MDLSSITTLAAQLNPADFIWIAGAVLLAILAIKVVAKIFKFLLIVGAVLLVLGFVFSSGFLPF